MLKSKMLTQLIEIKAICQRRRLCQGFTSELNYLTFHSSGDFLKYSATQAENIERKEIQMFHLEHRYKVVFV